MLASIAMPHKDRDASELSRADSRTSTLNGERKHREHRERDPNKPKKHRRIDPETGEPIRRKREIDPETGEPIRKHRPKDPITGEPIRRKKRDKEKDGDSGPYESRSSLHASKSMGSMAETVPELSRTASAPTAMGERERTPYPSLNKNYSKEAVYSREDIHKKDNQCEKKVDIDTPAPTNLSDKENSRRGSRDSLKVKTEARTGERPLTPPDTLVDHSKEPSAETESEIREEEIDPHLRPSSPPDRSWFGRPKIIKETKSGVSTKSKESRASTARKVSKPKVEIETVDDYASDGSHRSAVDSNATSVAPKRNKSLSSKPPGLDTDSGQSNRESSSPRTPTATQRFDATGEAQFAKEHKAAPSPFVSFEVPEQSESDAGGYGSPMPPPPPPPPMMPVNIPRVDYLMQNGGLPRTIPKTLLAVTPSYTGQSTHQARAPAPGPPDIEKVFGPFSGLLEQYETVLQKNGSVAVATGYRSVARRLLDRLESVFARELSYEGCTCIMCEQGENDGVEYNREIGWGDVLEWSAGKKPLPVWPAFDFGAVGMNVLNEAARSPNDADGRPSSPQKLDPDIDEQFREHFLRQSKKTKIAVDKWLRSSAASTAAPPTDVDDETLTFTILTHLDSEERPIFNALITGTTKPVLDSSRAPTPMARLRSTFIVNTCTAIQRLYRLPQPPRDPEATIYLLRNPEMHHLLVTIAQIMPQEWEILISGRFDGFLWSGAEDIPDSALPSPAPSRGPTPGGLPSRGPTPAHKASFNRTFSPAIPASTFSNAFPSRNPTPAQTADGPQRFATPNSFMPSVPGTPFSPGTGARHPVSNDEEAEIAVLAEVEREIYAGMEALEDAFEALHRKAEAVRTALRQRSAGLSLAAQSRRAGGDSGAFARLGTPGMDGAAGLAHRPRSAFGYDAYGIGALGDSEASESECGWGDAGEIAPDDSASNVSSSRTRRPKRRNERRTPAPVEEEDEE